eukprot:TRINITY_DN15837_c0_g1_i2.p3 TRINITY_DN15837_c0_g1~~TRINITY_DN15837_c0_g1_i2.p3  ORF type:complete len:108 (-),score=27.20 TRINITY_DN15837_c0_g1_i2:106-429(-)
MGQKFFRALCPCCVEKKEGRAAADPTQEGLMAGRESEDEEDNPTSQEEQATMRDASARAAEKRAADSKYRGVKDKKSVDRKLAAEKAKAPARGAGDTGEVAAGWRET